MQLLQSAKASMPIPHKTRATKLFLVFTTLLLCLVFVPLIGGARTAYAASVGSRGASVIPATSGGGCKKSSDGRVSACISVDYAHEVVADAYINSHCNAYVYITIVDETTGTSTDWYFLGYGCGHFGYVRISDLGDTYVTYVNAVFSDIGEDIPSPYQYG